jgi:hypothetical protein
VNTDELIATLAADAGPVRPLAHPMRRLGRWLLLAVPLVGAAVLAFGLSGDLASALADPRFGLTAALAGVTAAAAAAAALVLAVPGAERGPAGRSLPLALLAAWCAAMLALVARQGWVMTGSLAWPWTLCIAKVALMAAPPAGGLFVMVRRAAPLRLAWAAGLSGVAALSLGAFGVQFVCSNWHAGHLLLTHYAPVVVIGALVPFVGRRWLEWAPRG